MIAHLTLDRRLQWLGSSVLRMLEFFPRDRQQEVEGDDITVVVAAVRKKPTSDGECAVVHRVCAITSSSQM